MIDEEDRMKLSARIANLKVEITTLSQKPKTAYNLHWIEVDKKLLRDAETALESGKMPEYKRLCWT